MTQYIIALAILLVTVSPVTAQSISIFPADAEVQKAVPTVSQSCACEVPAAPVSAPSKEPAKKTVTARISRTPQPTPANLPFVGWPDGVVWGLAGMVLVLALVVAFLLGRVTAPVPHQPQVVAPVVYVQPPPQPAPAPHP